jgi:hypothetical protein
MEVTNVHELLRIKVLEREAFAGGVEKVKRMVFLPVNPYSVTFNTSKVYSEVQTASPMRYVVLDWGVGMTEINVSAQTGRILPFDEVYKKFKEFKDVTYEDLILSSGEYEVETAVLHKVGEEIEFVESLFVSRVLEGVWVSEDMNPQIFAKYSRHRYALVKLLEDIFKKFDANKEIMCMDWMKRRYYGLITNFSYTIAVESLWNIKYNFTFRQFPVFSVFSEMANYADEVIKTE